MPDQSILAPASGDHTESIWNMQEQLQLASLDSHMSGVSGVSFSAGGVLLASTAERDDMIHGTVRLWRTDTWEEPITLKELDSAGDALTFQPALPIFATRCHGHPAKRSGQSTASFLRVWDLDFETFLRNPSFVSEFNRIENDLSQTLVS